MNNRFLPLMLVLLPAIALGQRNDLSVLAGVTTPAASINVGSLASISGGATAAVQLDYDYVLKDTRSGSLLLDLPAARVFKASVGLRSDSLAVNQSQFFFTPGLRYQFAAGSRIAPYVSGGFGFGWFDAAGITVEGPVSVSVSEGFSRPPDLAAEPRFASFGRSDSGWKYTTTSIVVLTDRRGIMWCSRRDSGSGSRRAVCGHERCQVASSVLASVPATTTATRSGHPRIESTNSSRIPATLGRDSRVRSRHFAST